MITEAERQRLIDFYMWLSQYVEMSSGGITSAAEFVDLFIRQRCH